MPATLTITSEKLKEDVENMLNADTRIDAGSIAVEVEDTRVKLTGKVVDYANRRIAESDAAIVPGVTDVDNHLVVEFPEDMELPSDNEIRSNVRRSLRWDSTIDDGGIKVSVDNGVVMLDGSVPSYWQKFKAQDLAGNVKGVIDVDNDLSIAPLKNYADDLIKEEVTAEIGRNLKDNGTMVDVTVDNGIVTLSGRVPDLSSYRAAENISYYVRGVINVNNQLYIQPIK